MASLEIFSERDERKCILKRDEKSRESHRTKDDSRRGDYLLASSGPSVLMLASPLLSPHIDPLAKRISSVSELFF